MIVPKKHFKDAVNEDQYIIQLYKDKTTGDLVYRNTKGIVIKVADVDGAEAGANLALTGNLTVDGTTTLNGALVLGDAAGDTIAVAGTITTSLVFEGTTDNAFEVTLDPGDPTADRVVTLPDLTGTVVVTEGAQTVNGLKTFGDGIASDTIAEETATAGVTVDGALIKDSTIALADGLITDLSVKIGADLNNGLYGVSDTQLGVAVEGALVAMFDANGVATNEINEQIIDNGVTIDGLLIKDGAIGITATVAISSAQILAMGVTPIELLPAPGAGLYYDNIKIILEYTHVTTVYTTTSTQLYITQGNDLAYFGTFLTVASDDQIVIDNPLIVFDGGVYSSTYKPALNSEVKLWNYNGDDPTLGDGTMRAIINYTIRTFGA